MQRKKQQRSTKPKAKRPPNKKRQRIPPALTDEQIKKEIEREANRKPEFIRPDPASYS